MNHFQRRHHFRDPKKFYIIATEGACTEAIYFEALRPPRDAMIQLKILPTIKGRSHPKEVLARLRQYERESGCGQQDELWTVIDRDRWTEEDLNEVAKNIGEKSNYRLALSNPCFELWLVLHRRDASGQTSKQLQQILAQELGHFAKNDFNAPALLQTVDHAVERAQAMDTTPQEPWPRKQGTHVYRLVKRLLER